MGQLTIPWKHALMECVIALALWTCGAPPWAAIVSTMLLFGTKSVSVAFYDDTPWVMKW